MRPSTALRDDAQDTAPEEFGIWGMDGQTTRSLKGWSDGDTILLESIYLEMAGLYYIICVADAGTDRVLCTRPST
jgi:hypothetical protein